MPRRPRLDRTNAFHHVWNRGVDRQDVFFADSDRIEFGRQLSESHERFGIQVIAYCLMENHFHLLLHCPAAGLSAGMQQLSGNYTRHVNDRLGRDGPLFRGRFGSRLVSSSEYLANATRYIHRNALDLADVPSVDRYRWSSHRVYIGARATPPWLATGEVLRWFGDDRGAFHQFVADDRVLCDGQVRVGNVDALIDAAALVAADNLEDAPSARGLAKHLVVLTIGEVETARRWPIAERSGFRSPRSFKMAQSRALAAMRNRSDLDQLVGEVKRLALTGPTIRRANDEGGTTNGV